MAKITLESISAIVDARKVYDKALAKEHKAKEALVKAVEESDKAKEAYRVALEEASKSVAD